MKSLCWIIVALLCAVLIGLGVWLVLRPPYALGCEPSPIEALATAQQASAVDVDVLPERADMRAMFTPRSQGSQASCVSFAVSALFGNASPAFIYNQRTTSNCQRDGGMSLYNALAIVTAKGDCLESLMPYNTNDICTQPSDAALADALTRKASGYAVLWGTQGTAALDAVRSYLAAGTPVLVAVPVYQSFYANAAGTIGVHADGERYYGGHALLLVGYDKDGFWALNSWGASWGHDGFAYLSNEFVQQDAWEGWVINGLIGAQPTTLYVSVVDANGVKFNPTGGTVTLYRDNVEIITKEVVGGAQQFDTRIAATQYCVKPHPPAGYVSKTQAECMTDNAYLTFVWVAVTPTATATPSRTATPTPWPTATLTPTIDPDATPTPTPKCYGYHQFSYSERWTAIATGAALIGRDLGEILDWQNDETLVYAAEINLGAPLTRDYEITADDGSRIWCRAYAQGILAIRQVWPCKSERYGVVQWDGVENWVGGELP